MTRRARWPTIAAGGVVIAAGFAIALVEVRFPKGSVWIVVAVAALLLFIVRVVGRH